MNNQIQIKYILITGFLSGIVFTVLNLLSNGLRCLACPISILYLALIFIPGTLTVALVNGAGEDLTRKEGGKIGLYSGISTSIFCVILALINKVMTGRLFIGPDMTGLYATEHMIGIGLSIADFIIGGILLMIILGGSNTISGWLSVISQDYRK